MTTPACLGQPIRCLCLKTAENSQPHLARRLLLKQLSHARQLLGGTKVAVAWAAPARLAYRPPLAVRDLQGAGSAAAVG